VVLSGFSTLFSSMPVPVGWLVDLAPSGGRTVCAVPDEPVKAKPRQITIEEYAMSVGVKTEVELCWISEVLSDVDRAFLSEKGVELNALTDSLDGFRSKVYALAGPAYSETLAESMKPVVEAQAVALAGWEPYSGVFTFTVRRGLSLHLIERMVEMCDAQIAEGKSPWLGRNATELLTCVELTRERINGIKGILTVLLGHYV